MARVRTDNVFGTTTDNPLSAAATTMNSAGLANLVAVTGTDIAVVTLDPNRVNGAPEIVHVTAHTGAATSATILRAREGTAARSHPSGTFWVHAATIVDWGTDWAPWTPTLTNLTLGNGTVVARYAQLGKVVHYSFQFTLGSTSAVGTAPQFSLPVPLATASSTNVLSNIGQASFFESGASQYGGEVRRQDTNLGLLVVFNAASTYLVKANVTATAPFTWGTADVIYAAGTYEAA